MQIKYLLDIRGITIYTDFSLTSNRDETFESFVKALEKAPGTDKIVISRYKIEIEVGFLFQDKVVLDTLREVLDLFYPSASWGPIEYDDVESKILSVASDEFLKQFRGVLNMVNLSSEAIEA